MLTPTRHRVATRPDAAVAPPRRGVALVLVLVFVVAMAALAMSSIFMASSSTLLAKSYDREHDLRYAAEAALAIGKARVNKDPSILAMPADTLYRQLLTNATITGADGVPLPGIAVNVYVGPTGSSSGQNGRFASIVAQAVDTRGGNGVNGNGFIRRLELTQESFAKFAYWSNSETNNGATIFFNNGDQLWGPVFSNDVINIGSGGATFHDQVMTAKSINGKGYGAFAKTPMENQASIQLPSTAALGTLASYAAAGGTSLATSDGPNNAESQVLDRLEFVAIDMDGVNDSTSDNEGFFRYYRGSTGNEDAVRGDWPVNGGLPSASAVDRCGDWHWAPGHKAVTGIPGDTTRLKFYPVSVHNTTWFRNQIDSGLVATGVTQAAADSYANGEKVASLGNILDNGNARCFLAGDPHLVATDRVAIGSTPSAKATYPLSVVNIGGEDTTFTPSGRYGAWVAVPQTALNAPVLAKRPWDGNYLTSLSRKYNTNMKGVIYAPGNIGVSGTVNGLVTLYAKGSIVILDDLRYANDPVKSVCHDILGMISSFDVVVADNALNTPPQTYSTGTKMYFSLDDTKDLYVHAVIMALGTSFRVEHFGAGPTNVNDCDSVINGRGCIYLSGGLIQQARGAVGTSSGSGYAKRYTYDHCAVVTPPPYFPTTGRFQDNRYMELDPAGFNALGYFKSLDPSK